MMTRSIKFMAWVKSKKKMYYNVGFSMSGIQAYTDLDKFPDTVVLDTGRDNAILYQFTGLLDKEGKEIYEGHELVHPLGLNLNEIATVIQGKFGWEFDLYNNGFYGWEEDDGSHTSPPLKIIRKEWEHINDCKIIGHIAEGDK